MAAHNAQESVERAIRSILDQTYNNLELFVVDDGSTDETASIIDSIADARIIFERNVANRGEAWVWNYGLSKAQSEYVALQSCRDWSRPTRLEAMINAINRDREPLAVCPYDGDDDSRKKKSEKIYFNLNGHSDNGDAQEGVELFAIARRKEPSTVDRLALRLYKMMGKYPLMAQDFDDEAISPTSMVFKRTILEALGGFDLSRQGSAAEFLDRYRYIFPGPTVVKEKLHYSSCQIDRVKRDKNDCLIYKYKHTLLNRKTSRNGKTLFKPAEHSVNGNQSFGKFRHFILTRFNIGIYNSDLIDRSGRSVRESAAEWMEHRLKIFDSVCFPSIRAQTSQDFKWLVAFDEATPKNFVERIKAYQLNYPNFVPVFGTWEGKKDALWGTFFNPFIAPLLGDDTDYLITTRIDNDDAINIKYIETIQEMFCGQKFSIINFPNGYCYHFGTVYSYKHYRSPFLTLIEKIDRSGDGPAFHSVMSKMHTDFDDYSHGGKYFDFEPMWLQYIHARNISNMVFGVKVDIAKDDIINQFAVRV
jgi:glycosyltransferase involved in cell wall biosynthesis